MVSSVIFVDDDPDLREIFVELLEVLGIPCEAVASVAELQCAVEHDGEAYDLAVLDINLGADKPSGIVGYRWLRARGFGGRIAFLTGHGQSHPLVAEAHRLGDVTVHDKPIGFNELQRLLAT